MSKPSLVVVNWVKKKVLTGLVTVSEAASLARSSLVDYSPLEIVSPATHRDRLDRFARGEWNSGKGHLTAYNNRLGWLKEHLLPTHVGLVPAPVTA